MVEDEKVEEVMVEVEMVNDTYYHVDAMDHLDVVMVLDQDDNSDYFAIVVVVYLEVVMVFVVDNFVVLVVVVVVDECSHDPKIMK